MTLALTTPLIFAASLTADFVRQAVKVRSADCTLLDVGCGDGLIDRLLDKDCAALVAIDGNEEAIKKAQANGVSAIFTTLAQFEHAPFDVVFVSRALHHMPPLDQTVEKLASLLKKDGLLLIDDFGFELIDPGAAAWVIKQTKWIIENMPGAPIRHKWLLDACHMTAEEACALWNEIHWRRHNLLDSKAMKEALYCHFKVTQLEQPAYLFRYLCDLLPDTAAGAKQAKRIWQEERELITNGQLTPVGLRMTLRHHQ